MGEHPLAQWGPGCSPKQKEEEESNWDIGVDSGDLFIDTSHGLYANLNCQYWYPIAAVHYFY